MQRGYDGRDVQSAAGPKKPIKCRSFHFRYLELCRAKNLNPLPEIRAKNNATSLLEIYCDKLSVTEWLLIIEALHYDQVLQTISLRMRKHHGFVMEQLDTEKKAKLFKQKPVIYTKFVFTGLIEALANCIEFNKNLKVLKLEGLPLNVKYIESIAKALASNDSLRELSFHRSFIGDNGCEIICSTVKYLNGVEKIDLSDCDLSVKGAGHVADMIKMQKISRYTEGWEKSLRYRDVDINSISGLRSISVARNPQIGDDGVKIIAEVLKEDAWVKVVDMENCGLTDRGANAILDCLDLNSAITDFSIRNNEKISKFLQRNIRDHLGKGDDDRDNDPQYEGGPIYGMKPLGKNKKYTQAQLFEQIHWLQEQLSFERTLRKKAEQLNEKLNMQIMAYESKMETSSKQMNIPEGFVVVPNESLQSIINEIDPVRRNDITKLVNSVCTSQDVTPRSDLVTIRFNDVENIQSDRETSENSVSDSVEVEPRKLIKVRKVKSETKYVEPPSKDTSKKRESKSDYEFANEAEIDHKMLVHIETDIGDTVAVNNNINNSSINTSNNNNINYNNIKNAVKNNSNKNSSSNNNNNNNGQHCNQLNMLAASKHIQVNYMEAMNLSHNINSNFINNKIIDIDELSLTSTRGSELSSDSDTLRNASTNFVANQFLRHRPMEMGQGEGALTKKLSPRRVFMGL